MKKTYIDNIKNNNESDIILDENVKLAFSAKIMDSNLSGNIFVGLASCLNRCDIGRYVGIAYFSYLADVLSGNYCTFGSRVSIGAFSHPTDSLTIHEVGYRNTNESYGETVLDKDSESYLKARSRKTVIGNDVWVGDNSVIIKGIEVGNGAIIAAGSIVTKNVEPYSIVAGNPARNIRMRFSADVIERIQATGWWEYNMQELKEIPFQDINLSLEMLEEMRALQGK